MFNANTLTNSGHGLLLACLFLLALAATVHAEERQAFFFGDSLSDSGNAWHATGTTSKAPYALIPAAPYAIGGHHFTNGKTWAERFAQSTATSASGRATLAAPGTNGNYAFGGSRARSGSGSFSPSSAQQVQAFLADHGAAPGNALYVIQFGGNDLRDALVAGAPGTPEAQAAVMQILSAAVAETAQAVQTLYVAGARDFLVVNAPNLEHAPAVRLAGAGSIAGFLTGLYNGSLEGALQSLEGSLPGISIKRLDLAGFLDEVVADPAAFGLMNATSPCLVFLTATDAKCDDANAYLFWDGIHPTAAAHRLLAERASAAVEAD